MVLDGIRTSLQKCCPSLFGAPPRTASRSEPRPAGLASQPDSLSSAGNAAPSASLWDSVVTTVKDIFSTIWEFFASLLPSSAPVSKSSASTAASKSAEKKPLKPVLPNIQLQIFNEFEDLKDRGLLKIPRKAVVTVIVNDTPVWSHQGLLDKENPHEFVYEPTKAYISNRALDPRNDLIEAFAPLQITPQTRIGIRFLVRVDDIIHYKYTPKDVSEASLAKEIYDPNFADAELCYDDPQHPDLLFITGQSVAPNAAAPSVGPEDNVD